MTTIATEKQTIFERFYWLISDIWELTKRNLIRYKRSPRLIVFSTIQPIMFVILFASVFGGAIKIPGRNYIDFLIPAIIVQTVLFGANQTAVGLAEDMQRGLIDRFRSLPISRAAVLVGRTLADSLRNVFTILIMIGVGYLLDFRIQTSIGETMVGIIVALLFGFSMMWIMATVGLLLQDAETVQVAGFIFTFPLTFASSAFAPVDTMPKWLSTFAEVSPVTLTINTMRGLFITGDYPDLWKTFAWCIGILVIFIPLAVQTYRRRT